jgi:hypothetical protein
MQRTSRPLIVLFYDPETRNVWGRGGRFVALEEFVKYPPTQQEDVIPPAAAPAIPDPADVPEAPGPEIKCINGQEHVCFQNRCYPTGRSC